MEQWKPSMSRTPGGAGNCCCPVRRCGWKCRTTRNAKQNTTLWRYTSRASAGSIWTVRHPYFPDAPTERGVKHLHELAQAQRTGYQCAVAFVIQMEGITEVRPNVSTQPEFGTALAEAKAAGVQVLFLLCHVGRDSLEIVEQREG